jgi:hypothetical protein
VLVATGDTTAVPLPAICDTCGSSFNSGIAAAPGVRGLVLAGNKSGPCPNCGGLGSIPDGTYDIVKAAVGTVIVRAELSPEYLRGLASRLNALRRSHASIEEVRRALDNEPEAVRGLLDLLPVTRQDYLVGLGLIVMVLTLLATIYGLRGGTGTSTAPTTPAPVVVVNQQSPASADDVEAIVRDVLGRMTSPDAPPPALEDVDGGQGGQHAEADPAPRPEGESEGADHNG